MKKSFSMLSILLLILTLQFCIKVVEPPIKDTDFNEPEEYLENPSVKDAIDESQIPINKGDDPPVLSGDYHVTGEIIDASSTISQLIGISLNSNIKLYNQTNTGKISLVETVGNLTAWATGGYITGANGKFTIWQESEQSGEEAGLPEDLTINVALLISGAKLYDGDLEARGISIITNVETTNKDYNTKNVKGLWWMYDAYFDLQGGMNLKVQLQDNSYGFFSPVKELLFSTDQENQSKIFIP